MLRPTLKSSWNYISFLLRCEIALFNINAIYSLHAANGLLFLPLPPPVLTEWRIDDCGTTALDSMSVDDSYRRIKSLICAWTISYEVDQFWLLSQIIYEAKGNFIFMLFVASNWARAWLKFISLRVVSISGRLEQQLCQPNWFRRKVRTR